MKKYCVILLIAVIAMVMTPTALASPMQTDVNIVIDKSAPVGGQVSILADSPTQITVTPEGFRDEVAGLHPLAFRYRRDEYESNWLSGEFVDNELQPNTLYAYQVKVRDAVGNETPYSEPISRYSLAMDPISVLVEDRTERSVTIGINGHPANGTQPEYQLELRNKGTGAVATSPYSAQTSHRYIGGLNPGTEYEVWLTTRNGDGVANEPYLALGTVWTDRTHRSSSETQAEGNTVATTTQVLSAVRTAEVSLNGSDLAAARRALAQMPDGPERKKLELRLTDVEAEVAVIKVEARWTSSDLVYATTLLQQIQDGELKTKLMGRLIRIRTAMVINEAARQPLLQVTPFPFSPYHAGLWAVYLAGRLGVQQ